jgi:hypothetical protein
MCVLLLPEPSVVRALAIGGTMRARGPNWLGGLARIRFKGTGAAARPVARDRGKRCFLLEPGE